MRRRGGFTLWESLLALLVVAITGAAMAPLLAAGWQVHRLVGTLQPALDQGRLAMERLRREVRKADCATLAATPGALSYDNGAVRFYQQGEDLYYQSAATAEPRLLAREIQSLTFAVDNSGVAACLVTVAFTLAAPLAGQAMAIPLQTRVMVEKGP